MINAFLVSPWFDVVKSLGWTLLHSLWQLSIVAVALCLVLRQMKQASAASRYLVSLAALILMVAIPVAMFWHTTPTAVLENAAATLWGGSASGASMSSRPVTAGPGAGLEAATAASGKQGLSLPRTEPPVYAGSGTPVGDLRHRLSVALEPLVPWAVFLWGVGVLLGSLRLALGGIWIYRTGRLLRRHASDFLPELSTRMQSVVSRCFPVKLVSSALVEVPTVIGWFKPVIVLPMSSVAGLSPQQFEAIITHELAHLIRRDHIVNVFQTLVEIVLFYHPAAWWVSRQIREEREHCCDDMALGVCDSPYEYASALMMLVQNTVRAQAMAPAVSIAGGSIVRRVRRVLYTAESDNRTSRWVSGVVMVVAATALLWVLLGTTALGVLAANPTDKVGSDWKQVNFPPPAFGKSDAVGTVCSRKLGTDSFFDWKEEMPASGLVFMPPDLEFALSVNPEQASDLSFLETLPPDTLTGLLLGRFYVYRAGHEPPEKTYPDLLQTDERPRVLIGDDQMAHVAHLDGLREVYLDHATIGDEGVAWLAELDSLQVISLVDTEITDASLALLAELPNLRRLNLTQTNVTDIGVAYLASSESLEDITLDRTGVTDAGLAYLSQLDQLQRLSLNFTDITAAGLAYTQDMPSLMALRSWGANVTQEQREEAACGTGQIEYGLQTPKVGVLLSHYQATTDEHWMPFEYTYRHELGQAELLIDLGYDVYAVIEPDTKHLGYLPDVLERLGLQDRIVELNDPDALAALDVVASGLNGFVLDNTMNALTQAVKGGMGFFETGVFGVGYPGPCVALEEFLGLSPLDYFMQFQYVDVNVVASHPILGDLQPGDIFTANWLNGFAGKVQGTPLLMTERNGQKFCPLYVYELGEGTVVNMQWQKPTVTNGGIEQSALYGRCINFAAGLPVDATW